MMTATIAPPQCAPCLYAIYEQHRDDCLICTAALHADVMCFEGLILLDAALGDVGLPVQSPTNAMTRDLSELTLSALADELRHYTVRYQHSPTSIDEVRPWGGETGLEARETVARRLCFINGLVRSGVVSDWSVAS